MCVNDSCSNCIYLSRIALSMRNDSVILVNPPVRDAKQLKHWCAMFIVSFSFPFFCFCFLVGMNYLTFTAFFIELVKFIGLSEMKKVSLLLFNTSHTAIIVPECFMIETTKLPHLWILHQLKMS